MSLNEKKKVSQVKEAEFVKENDAYQSPYKGSAEDLLKEMQGEISPEATPLWQFINDNAPRIVAIVVALIVIIGGYAFYRGYHENTVADAKQQLAVIISSTDSQKVLTELEQFKSSAPSDLETVINLEIARFAVLAKEYEKAKSALTTVMNNEKYSALGIVAAMNTASLATELGEYENAVKVYEEIASHTPKDVQSIVYFQLGELAEKLGQKDKAIQAYKDGIALFEDVNSTDVIFYQSRIKALSK